MIPMNKFSITALAVCLLVLSSYSLFRLQSENLTVRTQRSTTAKAAATAEVSPRQARVAKVSVIYGDVNEYYDGAIATHQRHADRHGYPFYVLRNPVAEGYWNKAVWLQSLITQELAKPETERVEWLMWVDADSMILNREIPVEVFLPPEDMADTYFLTNKDQNGLNTGIFFVRVHPWSIQMFSKTVGFPLLKPEVDLGYSADQTAMAMIFNETGNRDHIMYQPRPWYNTYQFHHGYEGQPGYMLVHFPGLEDDRWNQMGTWLQTLNDPSEASRWSVPVEDTHYPQEVEMFWSRVRKAKQLLKHGKERLNNNATVSDASTAEAIERLEFALHFETDQSAILDAAIEQAAKIFDDR